MRPMPRAPGRLTAYAIVTPDSTLEADILLLGTTSQQAELYALARALHLRTKGSTSIWIPSMPSSSFSHVAIWKKCGFLTAQGSPIINADLISDLLQALQLPAEVATIHCKGHQTSMDPTAKSNARADSVARQLTSSSKPILFFSPTIKPAYSQQELFHHQEDLGAIQLDSGWLSLPDG